MKATGSNLIINNIREANTTQTGIQVVTNANLRHASVVSVGEQVPGGAIEEGMEIVFQHKPTRFFLEGAEYESIPFHAVLVTYGGEEISIEQKQLLEMQGAIQ